MQLRCKDPSSDSTHSRRFHADFKKPGIAMHTCNANIGVFRWLSGQPVLLFKAGSPRFRERPCLKKMGREQ